MNQDQDRRLTGQIREILELGTENIDTRVSAQLRKARDRALVHQKADHSRHHGLAAVITGVSPWMRVAAMMLALSVGATGTYYWEQYKQAAEDEIIDSALLADELPPDAYHDRGFQAWLHRASDTPSQ